jgi:hypothetical protein
MASRLEQESYLDEAYLDLVNQYIEALKQQVSSLRELIITMVADGYATKIQSELLLQLLGEIKSMKEVRAELYEELYGCSNGSKQEITVRLAISPGVSAHS